MRRLLRRLGARTGISLGLIFVITAVVVVARIIDGQRAVPFPTNPTVVVPTVAATEGDDGPIAEPSAEYLDDEAIRSAAADFTTAWLDRDRPAEQWLDGLAAHATADLIERLAGVDPLDVPATAVAGAPTIRDRSALYADVVVPIGAGDALVLGLVNVDGRWRVATLDRETSVSFGAGRRDVRALVALRSARDAS